MHQKAYGTDIQTSVIQNGGSLSDAGGAAKISDTLKRWVAGGSDLNKVNLSCESINNFLKTLFVPLLVLHWMACSHTTALDDNSIPGPGRCRFFIIIQ